MSSKRLFEDSFLYGVIGGGLILVVVYFLLTLLKLGLIRITGNSYFMQPPRVQLLAMLFNILLFRWMMLKWDMEKTGKGLLLITVLATFIYFFIFLRLAK